MRARTALLCLLAGTLLVLGCSRDEPVVAPDGAQVMGDAALSPACATPGGGALVPDGYYSFNWGTFAYSGFELISKRTGAANIIWEIGLTPEQGVTPLGLAFDLDGTLYTTLNFMDFDPANCWLQFARVDGATGAVTAYGPIFPMNTCGGDIDSHGNYYTMGMDVPHLGYIHGDGHLYRVDKLTGVFTDIGATGVTDWMDLAFDSHDRLWGTTQNKLFRIDTATGAITTIVAIHGVPGDPPPPPYTLMQEVMSIAFDDKDALYGTAMNVEWDTPHGSPVMKINVATGVATFLGYTNTYYNHGGDIYPTKVRICHRAGHGKFVEMTIPMSALPAHRAHGDIVPGVDTTDCGCPGQPDRDHGREHD